MKRRLFVKKFGQGLSSSVIMPGIFSGRIINDPDFNYQYPVPASIGEALNDEGLLVLRIEISGKSMILEDRLTGKIRCRKAGITRMKAYFNLGNNNIDSDTYSFDISAVMADLHVITLWLNDVSETSEVICRVNGQATSISLSGLLSDNQFEKQDDKYVLRANLLFHNELGLIHPGDHRIPEVGDNFRFIIMADPQGGDPYLNESGSNTRLKIHNAFTEESIKTANGLDPRPAFTLILGDFTDQQGEAGHFVQMIRFFKNLSSPLLLEIGNHESRYQSQFTPGYNMTPLNNYFSAQKEINGLEKLVYSFDLGRWHFIVWPDPLRNNFWETHPHYFDWLQRDLEKNKEKPTFFFQHVPIHPIGINPLVSYVNPVHINNLLFEILARHGNVKFVFSGHVHIPVKSSLKTAITYRGINLINLPPAGYRPRAFGEEDLYGGPCQGICIVDVDKDKADVSFKTITHEVFRYPASFNLYKPAEDPLWFKYKWEVGPEAGLVNGNFDQGLKGWMQKYVYKEDVNPSNICEVRKAPDVSGNALFMYVRKRGYDKPGQDRLPQTLNQLTQVIRVQGQKVPLILFKYRVDKDHFNPESWNGAFLWVEGYHQNHLLLNHVYAIGKSHRSLGGSYSRSPFTDYSFFDIFNDSEDWNAVSINLDTDLAKINGGGSFPDLGCEKLVLNFGVWTINEGYKQETGIYFKDVDVEFADRDAVSAGQVNGLEYGIMDNKKVWSRGIGHVAGEHQYVRQEEVYPY